MELNGFNEALHRHTAVSKNCKNHWPTVKFTCLSQVLRTKFALALSLVLSLASMF